MTDSRTSRQLVELDTEDLIEVDFDEVPDPDLEPTVRFDPRTRMASGMAPASHGNAVDVTPPATGVEVDASTGSRRMVSGFERRDASPDAATQQNLVAEQSRAVRAAMASVKLDEPLQQQLEPAPAPPSSPSEGSGRWAGAAAVVLLAVGFGAFLGYQMRPVTPGQPQTQGGVVVQTAPAPAVVEKPPAPAVIEKPTLSDESTKLESSEAVETAEAEVVAVVPAEVAPEQPPGTALPDTSQPAIEGSKAPGDGSSSDSAHGATRTARKTPRKVGRLGTSRLSTEAAAPAVSSARSAPVAPVEEPAATEVPKHEPSPVATADKAIEDPGLPRTLGRDSVRASFESVRSALEACAAGKSGVAEIFATVAGSGRVTYALVGGDFQGTPEGSCMARAVRQARFEPFSEAPLRVNYPFAL